MILFTKEQQESYENAKTCSIYQEYNIVKLEIIVIIQENIEVLRKVYVT